MQSKQYNLSHKHYESTIILRVHFCKINNNIEGFLQRHQNNIFINAKKIKQFNRESEELKFR